MLQATYTMYTTYSMSRAYTMFTTHLYACCCARLYFQHVVGPTMHNPTVDPFAPRHTGILERSNNAQRTQLLEHTRVSLAVSSPVEMQALCDAAVSRQEPAFSLLASPIVEVPPANPADSR